MNLDSYLKGHTKIIYEEPHGSRYVFYVMSHLADEVRYLLKDVKDERTYNFFKAIQLSNFMLRNNTVMKSRYLIEEVFDNALVE